MRFAGIILVIASLLLAACGQKGPLYLPPPPPAPQSTVPPTPSAPSPSTETRKPADRPFPDVPATTDK